MIPVTARPFSELRDQLFRESPGSHGRVAAEAARLRADLAASSPDADGIDEDVEAGVHPGARQTSR